MTLNKKDLTIEKAITHLYDQIPQNEDNDTVKEFLTSEIVDLQQECTTLEEEVADLKNELEGDLVDSKGLRAELEDEESAHEDTKMLLEEQRPPENLYDQQKREIILRLEKNFTLPELEQIEESAKASKPNYVID